MHQRLPYHLRRFFDEHSAGGRSLALITVLQTEGSTYSKTGSQMLVNDQGDFLGMLSGGCLEGDLADRASKVMASGAAELVSYDLRADDDVFGFGVGCEGALRILIQPLRPESDYEPFAGLLKTLETAPFADLELAEIVPEAAAMRILAPLKLLILGAGQDAAPLVSFSVALGWEVSVSDHRPAAIGRLDVAGAARVECIPAAELAASIDLSRFDAAVVMSHNLEADKTYLQALANSTVSFIGLLGPPHRRDRLLRELGADADTLAGRLRGPVGKPIGGRGPAAIALEIAAELQARFAANDQR